MMFDWLDMSAPASDVEPVMTQGVGPIGLIGAACVASPAGWRCACKITPGDQVLTFDNGMQPVAAVQSTPLWSGEAACPPALWPVKVPAGALGNRDLMYLAADQAVMIESDTAEVLTGDPFVLIPARSLEGVRDMRRVPPPEGAGVTILQFEDEQIIFANSGAMFHCPRATSDLLDPGVAQSRYDVLAMDDARIITEALAADSRH